MEGRMTVCNMSIEGGARAGMIAPDDKTFAYLHGRPKAPSGKAWDMAMAYWKTLKSDDGAHFDATVVLDAANLPPIVTWGTSPEQVTTIDGATPDPEMITDPAKKAAAIRALDYMGLKGNTKITDIPLDVVWIGSCTNGRIEDLRQVAEVVRGKRMAGNLAYVMVVPGSGLVKQQAEAEGLDVIFKYAGLNPDQLKPGQRCASTSNRNFEGRQGFRGRTHLVSPITAAHAALAGRFVDVRNP
jgi:3-isopropylmalate/(R)-2-methylmalate dehydratase large subunit